MSRLHQHTESHLIDRIGWLRAAVLGANDGIISTASLIVGVAAAAVTQNDVLIAGCCRPGGWRHVDGRRRVCSRAIAAVQESASLIGRLRSSTF